MFIKASLVSSQDVVTDNEMIINDESMQMRDK